MRRRSNPGDEKENIRRKIIGLGERSFRKSYYPELQHRFEDLERFRYLLNKTNDAIFVMEKPSGRILDANDSAGSCLGYSNREFLEKNMYELTDKNAHSEIRRLLEGNEGSSVFETFFRCKNGQRVAFEIAMHTTKSSQAAAIARNIQERRKSELALRRYSRKLAHSNENLEAAYKQLKKIDDMKSEFISLASHELRTPITSVLGFAQTLLASDMHLTEDERNTYLQIIVKEAFRLKELVNDLLDLSRIELGRTKINRESVNLYELIKETLQDLNTDKDKIVRVNSDKAGKEPLLCDRDKIRRVVVNIVENALRFSSEVTVSISAGQHERLVRIDDNGPGIPQKHLKKVFEKFYRITEDKTPGGGSGLGLAIAKEIVELHGGRIWAQSSPGKGASFFFTIKD